MPPENDRERLKAIEMAVGQIEKQFGKGSIMRLGQKDAVAAIPAISTGSVSLDYALGIGGVPRGRVVEIFGPESSGKTTLSLQIIAEAQKLGGMAAFVDAEHALDAKYAQKLGVDLDNLLVSQPDNGEQALEIVEVLVRSNGVDVVVVDSVAALVPRAEIEGEMGEAQMGLQARLMSQALRKLTGAVSKSKTCLIFINQLREKIGVMFGNPETTTGGRALKFYSSVRIDIRRIGAIKDGDAVVGGRTRVKVVKNKVAPPFREAEFDVMYGEGISKEGDLLDLAVDRKIVDKSGTWFAFNGDRLGQGRENVKQFLKDNPAVFKATRGKSPARARNVAGSGSSRRLGQNRSSGRGAGARERHSRGSRASSIRTASSGFVVFGPRHRCGRGRDDHEDFPGPDEPEFRPRDVFDRRSVLLQPANRFGERGVFVLQPRELGDRSVEVLSCAQRLGESPLANQRVHGKHARGEAQHAPRPLPLATSGWQLRGVTTAQAHRWKSESTRLEVKVQVQDSRARTICQRPLKVSQLARKYKCVFSQQPRDRGWPGCRSTVGTVMMRVLPEACRGSSVGRAQH